MRCIMPFFLNRDMYIFPYSPSLSPSLRGMSAEQADRGSVVR